MSIKPMLACDWEEDKVQYPVVAQPKVDGVRAMNLSGRLTGRSLKEHKNRHVTEHFSLPETLGFDGEMAAQEPTHPDLCRLTTSALNTILGEPYVQWWLFDCIANDTVQAPYHYRLAVLQNRFLEVTRKCHRLTNRLKLMPTQLVENADHLQEVIDEHLAAGYEGTILRDPNGAYKSGRCTVREGGLLRIKQFVDAEAVVREVIEGQTNGNEAVENELGHTSRSTHAENMAPNGMVGRLVCETMVDIVHRGRVLFPKGYMINVAPGRMPHDSRKHYFENPDEIIDQTIKFKFFPHGIKDKPRFGTFQSIRMDSDT